MRASADQFHRLQQPITTITATRRGMSWLAWLVVTLGRLIATLEMVQQLEFIHFAQWQRVRTKKLPRLSPDQPKEEFKSDFFMFTTNYNGDWDQYIDTFARVKHIRRGMKALWGTSQGFPGPIPLRSFKQYIHYYSYPEALYYSAYPAATVRNIEAAKAITKELEKFATPPSDPKPEYPKAFRVRYLELLQTIAPHLGSAPSVHPYTIATSEPAGWGPAPGRLAGKGQTKQTLISAMSPIEVKPSHAVTTEIAELIESVSTSSSPSPFAKCPMLHFARLVVIDDIVPKLGSSPKESLRTNYLLFVAAFDGELGDFLDCLYAADPEFVQGVWGRCLGYPDDREGPVYLRRYIERSLLPVQLPYAAFPDCTALDIRRALSIQADLLDWLASNPCSDIGDDVLMSKWQGWLTQRLHGSQAPR